MTQLYCLVENNAVTQGPQVLPFSFGNITGFNLVPDPTIYGWYPYTDPGAPSFDPTTQQLTLSFTIDAGKKTVTQAYSVKALPLDQIQINQQFIMQQSQSAKLQRQAATANAAGDTQAAVQYILKQQGNHP